MKIKIFLLFIVVVGALLILSGCETKSTEPEGTNYTINTWIDYSNWTQASAPTTSDSTLFYFSQMGKLVWYNPFDKVLITDIWPSRDVNAQTGVTTDALILNFRPNPDFSFAWNGIMRTYPVDETTPIDSGYIELWVKGESGTLHIDLGRISEDWWVLGTNHMNQSSLGYLNTEDVNSNGILDEEDTGVNGLIYSEQPIDWPDDRWRLPDQNTNNYDGINGTEGNSKKRGAIYPDTEDLNQNGTLDLFNDYFEYEFSLDEVNPDTTFLVSVTQAGWGYYKIPLNNPSKIIGIPSWTDIEFIRLWVDNVTENSTSIAIVEIKITE